jgi:hypothetical protein
VVANSQVESDFNDYHCDLSSLIFPAACTSTGQLSIEHLKLLHHYKTSTWRNFAIRGDATTHRLHRELVPQMGVSHSYLLYAILGIAASHMNSLQPSPQLEKQALVFRQKTLQSYSKEIQNITSDNYETILVTAMFLLALVPAPSTGAEDEKHLEWMMAILKLGEGIRIIASLRWAEGIEKLSVYPLLRRELRSLPPSPFIITPDKPLLQTQAGPLGTTPDHPNPAPTYGLPDAVPFAGLVFLPPPMMSLLESIIHPPNRNVLDCDTKALVPVFYALSPIFLSLYYYRLDSDFNVRVFVFTSFLFPEFLALVKAREPRALLLIAWFLTLASMVPKGWWIDTIMSETVYALARTIRLRGDMRTVQALEGTERVVEIFRMGGREKAAESVFEDWEGVNWADGPKRAAEWEDGLLLDLGDDVELDGLDLDLGELA